MALVERHRRQMLREAVLLPTQERGATGETSLGGAWAGGELGGRTGGQWW